MVLDDNSESGLYYYSNDCMNYIQSGDYVSKEKDSTFLIVKLGNLLKKFYLVCDGKPVYK